MNWTTEWPNQPELMHWVACSHAVRRVSMLVQTLTYMATRQSP